LARFGKTGFSREILAIPSRYSVWKGAIFARKLGVTQLTHLTTYFTSTYITLYTWSPDGRYIAFWVATNIPADAYVLDDMQLAVLDTVSQQVTLYCIKGNIINPGVYPWGIVWSPNSQQLMLENLLEQAPFVLVDIAQNFAAQIADDLKPVGWMKAP
jgi:Tol biopolymer transport system component